MLFQRFRGAGFTNNQFSGFSSVVVRSSLPVLSYPFLTVPFHLCFQYFLPFLHCSPRSPRTVQAAGRAVVFSPSAQPSCGTTGLRYVGMSSGVVIRGVTSWEEKRWLLGAQEFGSLRRHPQQPESTCHFLSALVSRGHPECHAFSKYHVRSSGRPTGDSQRCGVVLPALR